MQNMCRRNVLVTAAETQNYFIDLGHFTDTLSLEAAPDVEIFLSFEIQLVATFLL